MLLAIAETLSEMWIVGQDAKNSGQLWDSEDSLSLFWRCVWLTIQHLRHQTWGPSSGLVHCVVALHKELYSILSLLTQVYKWVLATYCWGEGVTLRSCPGGSSAVVWAFDLCVPLLFFPFHPRAYLLPVLANQEKTVLNNVIWN